MAPPKVVQPKEPAPVIASPPQKTTETEARFKVEGVGEVRAERNGTLMTMSLPSITGGETDRARLKQTEGNRWIIKTIELNNKWIGLVSGTTMGHVYDSNGNTCYFEADGKPKELILNENEEPVIYGSFQWKDGMLSSMKRETGREYIYGDDGMTVEGYTALPSSRVKSTIVTDTGMLADIEGMFQSMDAVRGLAQDAYGNAVKALKEMKNNNILGVNGLRDGRQLPQVIREQKEEAPRTINVEGVGKVVLEKTGEGANLTVFAGDYPDRANLVKTPDGKWEIQRIRFYSGWSGHFEDGVLDGVTNAELGCCIDDKGDVKVLGVTKGKDFYEYSEFQIDQNGVLHMALEKKNDGDGSYLVDRAELDEIGKQLEKIGNVVAAMESEKVTMEVALEALFPEEARKPKAGWKALPAEGTAAPKTDKKQPKIVGEKEKETPTIPFPNEALVGLNEQFFATEFIGRPDMAGSTKEHCKVLWTEDAVKDLEKFRQLAATAKGESGEDVEVMGLIRGELLKELSGEKYFLVKGIVMPESFDNTGVSVKFGEEGLVQVMAQWDDLQKSGVDDILGGWIHSHPDYGSYFSQTDVDTHVRMFKQDHQFGVVLDPVRMEVGTLTVKNGKPYYINSRVYVELPAEDWTAPTGQQTPESNIA